MSRFIWPVGGCMIKVWLFRGPNNDSLTTFST
jgi:hypothetical protein